MKSELQRIGMRAQKLGIYSVESECPGFGYFYDDGEFAIMHNKGYYIRIPEKYLDSIIEELIGIKEDIEDLKIKQVSLRKENQND